MSLYLRSAVLATIAAAVVLVPSASHAWPADGDPYHCAAEVNDWRAKTADLDDLSRQFNRKSQAFTAAWLANKEDRTPENKQAMLDAKAERDAANTLRVEAVTVKRDAWTAYIACRDSVRAGR